MNATKHKRGDVREDGKVFLQYRNSGDKEYWVSQERFNSIVSAQKKSSANRRHRLTSVFSKHPRKYKRGDTRKDGKVFWQYQIARAGFERWMTKVEFEEAIIHDNAYKKNKRASDPMFKMRSIARCRVNEAHRNGGYGKDSTTSSMLGCSYDDLLKHIGSQFTEGMTWDNQGDWHHDHILPLSAASNHAELKKLCHHKNIQPLWAKDNLAKGDSYCPKQLKEYLES